MIRFDIASSSGLFAFIRAHLRSFALNLPFPFARLRDRSLFEQVTVEMGAVVWPCELDLAPDAMHAATKQHGEWKIEPWRL
ncbi:MAG TPA: hypothetical protein VKI44_35710 [Acetobacteraceae bacterium]|nr:hypothetical protein [Acetobacteraceae bacterium]